MEVDFAVIFPFTYREAIRWRGCPLVSVNDSKESGDCWDDGVEKAFRVLRFDYLIGGDL